MEDISYPWPDWEGTGNFTESNSKHKGFKFLEWIIQREQTLDFWKSKTGGHKIKPSQQQLALTSHWVNGSVFKLQDPPIPILMTQVISLPNQRLLKGLHITVAQSEVPLSHYPEPGHFSISDGFVPWFLPIKLGHFVALSGARHHYYYLCNIPIVCFIEMW